MRSIDSKAVVWAVVSAAWVGLLALNSQSFWIDELGTWRLTQAAGWADWLEHLLNWRNSDAQLPLYHAWIKLWVTWFGDREWVMRASNLPWLAVGLYAYWRAPVSRPAVSWVRWAGVLCALHPLTWYYTNELRPYVVLLAAASWAGVGLVGVWHESTDLSEARLSRHFLLVGLALLAAMSAIGAIWTLAFVVSAVVLSRSSGRFLGLESSHMWTLLAGLLVVVPVFAQYVHSFLSGITATTLHDHKLVNFAFAFYELLGLAGVGPGRDDLRVAAGAALRAQGPAMAPVAVVLIGTLALGLRALWCRDRRTSGLVLALSLLPVLVLLGLAELKHWRVVGRHMVPLLFFVCLVWAAAVQSLWRQGDWMSRAWVGLMLSALLASSLSVRWAERHEHERYRDAAEAATATLDQGGVVWWFADAPGPEYFGLGARTQKLVRQKDFDGGQYRIYLGLKSRLVFDCSAVGPGTLLVLENPDPAWLEACPAPEKVVFSRRDTFDRRGAGEAWMTAHGMRVSKRFLGFEIWE